MLNNYHADPMIVKRSTIVGYAGRMRSQEIAPEITEEPAREADEETRWLTADEQLAWRAFLIACQTLFSAVDAQLLRDSDIPHGYYEILVRLSETPGRALRMTQLAEASTSSKSRLSHAVARLEERGWVRRTDCPTDRRGQVAQLTDEGFAALAAAAPGHVDQVRRSLIDQLTPEQVGQLREISDAIIAGTDPDVSAGGCLR
jgi:DNA-binding MarR family transcriptional regulator